MRYCKSALLAVIFSLMLCTAGCGTKELITEEWPESLQLNPEENLQVDLSIEYPQNHELYAYDGRALSIEPEAIMEWFQIKDATIQTEGYDEGDCFISNTKGERAIYADNCVFFCKNDEKESLFNELYLWLQEANPEDIPVSEMTNESREAARAAVENWEKGCTLSVQKQRVYHFTKDDINEIIKALGETAVKSDGDSYEGEDVYYVELAAGLEQFPLWGTTEEPRPIISTEYDCIYQVTGMALIDSGGLEYFRLQFPFEVEKQEAQKMVPGKSVIGEVLQLFGDQILTEPVTIDHMYLEYFARNNTIDMRSRRIEPYWIIEYKQGEENSTVIINALTGENLEYGW